MVFQHPDVVCDKQLSHLSAPLPHVPVDWAARGELQAAQRSHHVGGVEPRRLQCVRRVWSGWRRQPVGPVGGVVWCRRPGRGDEGPAPSATVSAPGSVRDQGDPLAPADAWSHDLHGSVWIQCVQDDICVECVCVFRLQQMELHIYCVKRQKPKYISSSRTFCNNVHSWKVSVNIVCTFIGTISFAITFKSVWLTDVLAILRILYCMLKIK